MPDTNQLRNYLYEFIQRYVDEIYEIVTSPSHFFLRDSEKKGLLEPTTFAAFNILIPKAFYALLFAPLTLGLSILTIVPSVLYGICSMFILAILFYGLLRFVGSQMDFETTYRNVAYSSVASYAWLIPIPFLNLLLYTAGYCALLYFAFREVHGLDKQKCLTVLIFPAILILLIGFIITLVTLWILISAGLSLIHYIYV